MVGNSRNKPIFAIAGPTASGKTALAVRLAEHVNGEIINFDSVQIYQGIRVATAKPTPAEMRGIPHHLIDYIPPEVSYTAADWAADAAARLVEIESRGKTVIFVGGTGFYLRTLRHPLFESAKTNPEMRQILNMLADREGASYLYRMLERLDPKAAEKLFPNDRPRIIRALEVIFETGEAFSALQPRRAEAPEFAKRMSLFVLNPPRELLYERINSRTEAHFAAGLVDEVAQLLASGVPESGSALGAHGYRRVCEYLRGERTLSSALERTKQDVRNYAKRQLTWFRKEPGSVWIDTFGDSDLDLSVFGVSSVSN